MLNQPLQPQSLKNLNLQFNNQHKHQKLNLPQLLNQINHLLKSQHQLQLQENQKQKIAILMIKIYKMMKILKIWKMMKIQKMMKIYQEKMSNKMKINSKNLPHKKNHKVDKVINHNKDKVNHKINKIIDHNTKIKMKDLKIKVKVDINTEDTKEVKVDTKEKVVIKEEKVDTKEEIEVATREDMVENLSIKMETSIKVETSTKVETLISKEVENHSTKTSKSTDNVCCLLFL